MAIIYETINLYNRDKGLSPWRYIGSDQHNNPSYLGSNKKLKEDIRRLGTKIKQSTKEKMSESQNGGLNNSNSLEWDIIFPNGQQIRVKSLRTYCRNNNLSFDDIYFKRNGWNHIKHGACKGGGRKKKEKSSEY